MKSRDGVRATSGPGRTGEEAQLAAARQHLSSGSEPPSSAMPPAAHLGRVLAIITGASRGFGRALARDVSRSVRPGSALVLVARSGEELRALQAELTGSEAGKAGLKVEVVVADVGQTSGLEDVLTRSKQVFTEDMDHLVLFNNAASLGDVSCYTKDFTDMTVVDSYLSLNVSSALCLTARVLQAFPQSPGLRRTVVNVSSLCAQQPFPSWVLYCTGKAARDMTFRVLAEEEPDLRVLSYAPGPLDTSMQVEARTKTADPNLKRSCSDLLVQGQLLSCEASCSKLMKVLLEDHFTSGAHVDVFDV